MTLRARLTLWYTAVLAVVLILFGSIVYISLSFNLTNQIENTLDRTADDILITLADGIPEDLALTLRALDLTSNVSVQILQEDGEIVWQSGNTPTVDRAFDPENLSMDENVFSSRDILGVNYRILTVPVVSTPGNAVLGYLQLGTSLATVNLVTQTLLIMLLVGEFLALIVAAIIGYLVAGAALSPLDEVTQTAIQITNTDDLSRRIPFFGRPNDEVGRLIQAFNATMERLEGLFKTQKRFLADVSHELRTPLTAIRGNVDLIRQFGVADEESLDAISSEVDRLTRLVRDLLLLAQAETGKLPLSRDPVELDTLMLEVFQQAKVLAGERINVRIGNEDQARVEGDRDRLKQVLLNVVANALEHAPDGSEVRLGLKCEGRWAQLSVADEGSGIPEDELSRIFERFYRRDPSRNRNKGAGAGLGLSIAYWIARHHGGDIKVKSSVGEGTTFVISIPLLEGPCLQQEEEDFKHLDIARNGE
ncbi:MAG: HAMP domain-containing protein [Anaerolineales bacterium]|nr:HAMP domain-containing protein [Anaerolineales bacterium]